MNADKIRDERYNSCRKDIADRFFEGRDPGELTKVLKAGDSHFHGDAVCLLRTSGGERLYYKPRDGRCSELLGDVNELLFGKRLVPMQVSGEGFAFQKPSEPRIPETEEEKRSFYSWMGRLTAVFYALGSVDMHAENVLCCGGLPVVVDTETLLAPRSEHASGAGEFSADYGEVFTDYRASVGKCMVLPRFYALVQKSPLLPGRACTVEGYEAYFLSGFGEGYHKICENREGITRILKRYASIPLRCLLRSTATYVSIGMSYRNAKTPEEQDAVLKRLEKGLSAEDLAYWDKVLARERSSIREGDIPAFAAAAGKRDLTDGKGSETLIKDFLDCSAIEDAERNMARMGETDLRVQTAYIRASLKHLDGWTCEKEEENTSGTDAVLSGELALTEVREAVKRLWEERIPLSEGKILWHAPFVKGKPGSLFGLAEGFSGTAFFLHTCAGSTLLDGEEKQQAAEMSAAAFRSMAAFGTYLLDAYPQPPAERILFRRFSGGLDFPDGLAGFLWALRQCRNEDSETAERLLREFESWKAEENEEQALAALKRCIETAGKGTPEKTDILEGGNAGLAAILLLDKRKQELQTESREKAGRILFSMLERKKETGCYQVFQRGRKQYFLPAFLRGSTGIAWVMLRYAENVLEEVTNPGA